MGNKVPVRHIADFEHFTQSPVYQLFRVSTSYSCIFLLLIQWLKLFHKKSVQFELDAFFLSLN